jgi:hypothetical protein
MQSIWIKQAHNVWNGLNVWNVWNGLNVWNVWNGLNVWNVWNSAARLGCYIRAFG